MHDWLAHALLNMNNLCVDSTTPSLDILLFSVNLSMLFMYRIGMMGTQLPVIITINSIVAEVVTKYYIK